MPSRLLGEPYTIHCTDYTYQGFCCHLSFPWDFLPGWITPALPPLGADR